MDYKIIRKDDIEYPRGLLDLTSPPRQLYALGNLELLTRPAVSIVGTRLCSRYGTMVAEELAGKCADNGICVISGLADGIDTAAHIGAKNCTIAVLGNGLDCYYPISNKNLQDQIGKNGLLLSEYPIGFRGDKGSFPQRNRIVAALARCVVAVEADIKSGTFITVKLAKKLGRDIFAVPGNITSSVSQGTNKLIKDKDAVMLSSTDDIIKYFGKNASQKEKVPSIQLDFNEKAILDIIKNDEIHIDEIIEKSGFSVPMLSTLLTNMEMTGLIEKLPGNIIVAKNT